MATKRKKKQLASMAQIAQRELAWALYISEGYKANIERLITVNAYTLDQEVLKVLDNAYTSADNATAALRAKLKEIADTEV